ncbi:MAG TPA: carbon-nitrogen hydrolase family protein [Caulobacteraceae bacterium]|jgi:predicted amidohydrolase|nr:carbon-nitrogen hydrolase family protein [Caulobacteraceae bacterium]
MSAVRVGLVQLRTPADQAAAFRHAEPLVRQAAAEGAQFIVTPEVTNLVQRNRALSMPAMKPEADDPCVRDLIALAAELKVWLLIGSAVVLREGGGVANRSILIDPDGREVVTYDKMHMFDVDLPSGEKARESEAFVAGDAAVVADTPLGRIGLSICYDVRFAYLYRALAKAGAQILTVPAAFTRSTGEAHWEILLRARAIETGSFVLAPAQGGLHEDGRGTWGRSMIIGPWGEVLARADGDEPGVISATLDLDAVAKARQAIPALKNERGFNGPFVGA